MQHKRKGWVGSREAARVLSCGGLGLLFVHSMSHPSLSLLLPSSCPPAALLLPSSCPPAALQLPSCCPPAAPCLPATASVALGAAREAGGGSQGAMDSSEHGEKSRQKRKGREETKQQHELREEARGSPRSGDRDPILSLPIPDQWSAAPLPSHHFHLHGHKGRGAREQRC
ncbi:unnamed protein product [Closterium sp. NIES-54]